MLCWENFVLKKILEISRFLLVLPIIGSLLLTVGVVVAGLGLIVVRGWEMLQNPTINEKLAKVLSISVIQAIDLLNDPGIGSLVQARGLWDTLRKILGSEAPDFGRYVNRGQSGLRLFDWIASSLPALRSDAPAGQPLLTAGSPAVAWASTWLAATGIGD